MLKIFFGDMSDAVYNTASYFKYDYEDEWIIDPFVKEMIQDVDANGKLHPHHTTVSGYRYYSDEQLNQVINVKPKNALQLDIVAFPAINRKMIWNDRMIMLRHIFWQKDSHLR